MMAQTLLIGLDGATFYILDSLAKNNTMPFLKEFMDGGVHADLLSTPNPLTPPAWISIITGRSPGHHGVFDFIWAEERKTSHYFTLHDFRDIRCETIWSIASRQDKKICSLNFPMMSPPPEVCGYIVPGLVSWKHLRRNVYPLNLYNQLKSIPDFNAKDLAWDFDLEKKAANGVPREEFEKWISFHICREKQWFQMLRYLMKHDPCHLTAIVFDGVDKIFHMGWRFLDPKIFPQNPSEWEKRIRNFCLDYFKELDNFLKEIVNLAGPYSRVFIASDHGFGPSQMVFRVNTWLNSKGYLTWKNIDHYTEKEKMSAKILIEKHFVLLDWDKTTAYARSTTSNGIYIRVAKEPGQSGVSLNQYISFRNKLVEELKAIQDPVTNKPVIKQIFSKEEAFPGEHNSQAADLTLVMHDHSFISILNKSPIVHYRDEIEGTHYPEGVFIGNGPGIKKGVRLSNLLITDVAPALLYSLGLPIPLDFERPLPEDIFESSFLEEHKCVKGEPTQLPDSCTSGAVKPNIDNEEEAQILSRLRMLGYVE